jgi:broad specificity phosphatase PhoE
VIYLVRHGETAHNRDGLGLGREDAALTALGLAQAEALSRRFAAIPLDRVLTSPLSRAAHIADRLATAASLEAARVEALTELDVGETEGLTFAEMRTRYREFLGRWAGEHGWMERMPGGESMRDLAERLEPLVMELRASEGTELLLVSHNFTLRALICLLLGVEVSRFRNFEIGLASVTTLTVRNGRIGVRAMNDTCHLASLNLA